MWGDTLSRQSHRVLGLLSPTPKNCTHRGTPWEGPSACQPCVGKESRKAAHEFLKDADTADRLPCSIGRRTPVKQIRHSHHFIC